MQNYIKVTLNMHNDSWDLWQKYSLSIVEEYYKIGREEKLSESRYCHNLICAYLEHNPDKSKEYLETLDYCKYLKEAEEWFKSLQDFLKLQIRI